jgi:hypothetical protein
VSENDPSTEPVKLEYAAPARRGRPVLGIIVAILGMAAGMFGALMLFYGIPGIIYVFARDNRADFPGDLFEAAMFLIIGSFCLAVAIRWCCAARGIMRGE